MTRESARRLGLPGRLRVVARGGAQLSQPGAAHLRLCVRRAARTHLAGADAVRVTLRVHVVDDVGTRSTVRRKLALHR